MSRAPIRKILLTTVFAAITAPAMAGPILFTGNTTGALIAAVSPALTFTAASFSFTTDANGNGSPFTVGTLSINDQTKLGFSAQNDGLKITLNLSAGSPFAGATIAPLTVDLWGQWNGFFGTLDIWGDPVTVPVTFSSASGHGSFNLALYGTPTNFVSELTPDSGPHIFYTGTIQAQITNASFVPAPEPMSAALMGVGLLGLAFVRRWR